MNIVTCRGCAQLPYGMPGYCIHSTNESSICKIVSNLSHAVTDDNERILLPLTDIAWCSHASALNRGHV